MVRKGRRPNEHTAIDKKRWRIGEYIRLSKEDGADESLSVVNQRKIIDEFVERTFTDEDHEIVDYFIDDGKTGTDYDRPEFQRLMDYIKNGKVNCVICKTLARAFRNYSDQGLFLEDFFPRHETRFISIGSPQVDTFTNPDAISGMEVPITGLMNDRFAARTSEDIRRTFNTKRRKGEFIGAFPPYGYAKHPDNKNSFVIDEEAAQIVRDIYSLFVNEGFSKIGIAKRLNELGIPNPTAYKRNKGYRFTNPSTPKNDGLWSPKTVHDILCNQMYLGHMVQGRQKVVSYKVHDRIAMPKDQWFIKENTHDPIISQEMYNRALDLFSRDTRTNNNAKHVHLFSGYVKCADCHKAMQRSTSGDKAYILCRTYSEKSSTKCTRHSIREDQLEQVVLASIRTQVMLAENLSYLVEKINAMPVARTQTSRIDSALQSRKQEFEKVRNAISNLYMDWKNGDITKDDFKHMKETFETQKNQIEKIIAVLEEEKTQMGDGFTTDHPIFADFLRYKNIERLDRSVITALVDEILIGEKKEVTLRFKFADQFQYVVELCMSREKCAMPPTRDALPASDTRVTSCIS